MRRVATWLTGMQQFDRFTGVLPMGQHARLVIYSLSWCISRDSPWCWSNFLVSLTIRAAAFNTRCSLSLLSSESRRGLHCNNRHTTSRRREQVSPPNRRQANARRVWVDEDDKSRWNCVYPMRDGLRARIRSVVIVTMKHLGSWHRWGCCCSQTIPWRDIRVSNIKYAQILLRLSVRLGVRQQLL